MARFGIVLFYVVMAAIWFAALWFLFVYVGNAVFSQSMNLLGGFGAIDSVSDAISCPARWCRHRVLRREVGRAAKQARRPRTLPCNSDRRKNGDRLESTSIPRRTRRKHAKAVTCRSRSLCRPSPCVPWTLTKAGMFGLAAAAFRAVCIKSWLAQPVAGRQEFAFKRQSFGRE